MITASPTAYATYVKQYPTHEKFLNRKINLYDEMGIVAGKDLARGNYSKTFADIDASASMENEQPSMTVESVPKLKVVLHPVQGHIEKGPEWMKKGLIWNKFLLNYKKWLVHSKKI